MAVELDSGRTYGVVKPPICSAFPALFEMSGSKGAKVVDLWGCSGTGGSWNLR